MTGRGSIVHVAILLQSPVDCDAIADAVGEVAYQNCLLEGGSASACSIVRDTKRQEAYDECVSGGGIEE